MVYDHFRPIEYKSSTFNPDSEIKSVSLRNMAKERKWILKTPADPEKVSRLSAELGIDRVLAALLVKRGVETFEQARSFFRPSLSDLHDPFLMKDMDKAVDRVRKAITSEEKILVYGDYDVDERDRCDHLRSPSSGGDPSAGGRRPGPQEGG